MAQPSHIFIVGSYRTGTTLLRHTLSCSKDVELGGETHFFKHKHLTRRGYRDDFRRVGDLSTDAGAKAVVDYIYNNIHRQGFWQWLRENVDQQEFLQRLLETDRTERALFDLMLTFYANDKPIRGEKTPSHIYDVPTLLEWFPDAKIIHTFRDPRAIYVSNKKKRSKKQNVALPYRLLKQSSVIFEVFLSLNVLVTWLRIVRLHHRYQQLYAANYYLSRYEDLITDPHTHLDKICRFLEIDFTQEMLEQTVVNSSFGSRQDQKQGFDVSAIDRWRDHIHPVINKWFILWCKKYLVEFGYQP
jgi:Sulfotransferase family